MDQPMSAAAAQTGGAAVPGALGLWSLLICSLFPMFGLFALGPALPLLADNFATDPNAELMAQLIGGASGFAFALASPVIGGLIGRWGFKSVYLVSLVGLALVGALPAVLGNLPLIVLTRVILGVFVAGGMIAGLAGIGTLPAAVQPRMYGRNAVVASVGAMVTFPAVGALATYDWRLPFLIHLLALVVVPMALTLPSSPRQIEPIAQPSGNGLGVPPVLLAMAGFIGLVMYVGPVFTPFYLRTIDVTDPRLAALPMSAMSIASLLMTTNYRRLHARFGARALFAAILLLVGCGLLGAGLARTLPVYIVGMFIVACGLALFSPNINSHIAATSANPARGIGWAMSAMFAVQVIFPFLALAISDTVGPSVVFYLFSACALVGAGIVALRGGRRNRA
jgi:MFS family permease